MGAFLDRLTAFGQPLTIAAVLMRIGLAVVIGAVIYYVVIQIVLQLGLNTNDLKLLTALVVALFLAVPYWKTIVLPKKKEV